jgi:hypothetical protein
VGPPHLLAHRTSAFSSSSPVTPPTLAVVRSTAIAEAVLRTKRVGRTHVTLNHHLSNPYVVSTLGAATLRHDGTPIGSTMAPHPTTRQWGDDATHLSPYMSCLTWLNLASQSSSSPNSPLDHTWLGPQINAKSVASRVARGQRPPLVPDPSIEVRSVRQG